MAFRVIASPGLCCPRTNGRRRTSTSCFPDRTVGRVEKGGVIRGLLGPARRAGLSGSLTKPSPPPRKLPIAENKFTQGNLHLLSNALKATSFPRGYLVPVSALATSKMAAPRGAQPKANMSRALQAVGLAWTWNVRGGEGYPRLPFAWPEQCSVDFRLKVYVG